MKFATFGNRVHAEILSLCVSVNIKWIELLWQLCVHIRVATDKLVLLVLAFLLFLDQGFNSYLRWWLDECPTYLVWVVQLSVTVVLEWSILFVDYRCRLLYSSRYIGWCSITARQYVPTRIHCSWYTHPLLVLHDLIPPERLLLPCPHEHRLARASLLFHDISDRCDVLFLCLAALSYFILSLSARSAC